MSTLYVHATIKLRNPSGVERFCEAKAKIVPILETSGWKLVGAWGTILGRMYTLINVYEVPSLESYLETAAKWKDTADGKAFRTVAAEVVEEETISVMRKLPYGPSW
jgi:NIPSNAP